MAGHNRILLATCIVIPVSYWYWSSLLESLDGSTWKAWLVVGLAWVFLQVDNADMVGQPEAPHHHDD
jgi:hypothetical protein